MQLGVRPIVRRGVDPFAMRRNPADVGRFAVRRRSPGAEDMIGFSLQRVIADEAELLLLAVAPAWQRRGIGRALLGHFIDDARARGAHRLHLEVRDGNPAIRMYRLAGFDLAGRRSKYYHGADGQLFDAVDVRAH